MWHSVKRIKIWYLSILVHFLSSGVNFLELSMATPFCQDVRERAQWFFFFFDCHKLWYIWPLFQPQVESCWGTICPQLLWSGKQKPIKELAGKWYVLLSSHMLALFQPHSTPAPEQRFQSYGCAQSLAFRQRSVKPQSYKIMNIFFKGIIPNTVALNAFKLVQHSNWAKPAGNSAILCICCQF